jgi:hypothetical protein
VVHLATAVTFFLVSDPTLKLPTLIQTLSTLRFRSEGEEHPPTQIKLPTASHYLRIKFKVLAAPARICLIQVHYLQPCPLGHKSLILIELILNLDLLGELSLVCLTDSCSYF